MMHHLPLKGLIVLEFSQYLSGPSAGLRLADFGARVIKLERPNGGDAGRKLAIKNLWVGEDSLLFHTINRNKESFTVDLKNAADLATVRLLIQKADIVTHNFRPGIMEKIGLDYASVKQLNPRIIYGEISGYGNEGPWKNKPGQDLLLQSVTGLSYTTGNASGAPVPFGLSIADSLCGAQLVQGILAALIRRQKKGIGAFIQISLMESLLDFQFELLTTYFNSQQDVKRSAISNGNPLLGAPYGIYQTADGFIAIAMMDIHVLADAIECPALKAYSAAHSFVQRDEIKEILSAHLKTCATEKLIAQLHRLDLWAMPVLDWNEMMQSEAYQVLNMEQPLNLQDGTSVITTRCPIRINHEKLYSLKAAPSLGQDNEKIKADFLN
jgi:crotonobetainyl-CoA:carnitine CoA-transferase CaiB-like acyl-CoA transferase